MKAKRRPQAARPRNRVEPVVRHIPRVWERLFGVRILDPDGWRQDGKSLNAPLTRKEFMDRFSISTAIHKENNELGRT